ncbi:MarR family winged helix-turn-helix transcriptional regulator [uncultured Sphingomonas sp.]|uniref:MarR family winged helix-turn-helix transcriptional regulator n=1 Tax=uncultured Sphingomonas sp. TaxID=158754 RepID=UPI0025E4C636|nr:MarR family winged helix-turn-helix transcriptional regulator [uncultured Sphingomonas sp.]
MNGSATASHLSYEAGPTVEFFADSPLGLERCRRLLDVIGVRARPLGSLAEANAALAAGAAADAVLLDLTEDPGAALDELLDRIEDGAAGNSFRSVVSISSTLLDCTTARLQSAGVALLCDTGEIEAAAALGLALAIPRQGLREKGEEAELRRLSEEVNRIARALAQLSTAQEPAAPLTLARAPVVPGTLPSAATLRMTLRARRMRDQYFTPDLFADPAWDMLLDLMLARLEGRTVAVSSLCIAAAVPPTTALRWIKRLTDEGVFVRTADPRDGRRVFIDLSEAAANSMASYFNALERIGTTLA